MAHGGASQLKSRLLDGLRRLREWPASGRNASELAECDRDEVERMARELGLSARDLEDLAALGSTGADLLYRRLEVLSISPGDLERLGTGILRDLERTCSYCEDKGICSQDLAEHNQDSDWRAYCPNATTLEAVVKMKGRFPA